MILPQIRATIFFVGFFSVITGIIYPLFITGLGQLFFPFQANGSMLEYNGDIVGSSLIGQQFTASKYFWGRPSATESSPYNALKSSGSNLSPSNPELILAIKNRIDSILKEHPDGAIPIPLELVTASASGLDPHISVKGALFQVQRIATQRKISAQVLEKLIAKHNKYDSVNVLALNLALDELAFQGNKIL